MSDTATATLPAESEASRYHLAPAKGFKASAFGIGLGLLILQEEAREGRPTLQNDLQRRSGLSIPTWRKLLFGAGLFEVKTLRAAAEALGADSWEDVARLGKRLIGVDQATRFPGEHA